MNDDAKFFFFLSGFFGFVFFYTFSLILYWDLVMSLIFGAIGSLVVSFFGRILLISALKKLHIANSSNTTLHESQVETKPKEILLGVEQENIEDSSLQANLDAVANGPKVSKDQVKIK